MKAKKACAQIVKSILNWMLWRPTILRLGMKAAELLRKIAKCFAWKITGARAGDRFGGVRVEF